MYTLSPQCTVLTIIYLKQTVSLGYIVLQLFCRHYYILYYIFKLLFNFCNENQIGALFILNLCLQATSTCFGHMLPIIRRYSLYMYINFHVFI
jgi:hypothetical protein